MQKCQHLRIDSIDIGIEKDLAPLIHPDTQIEQIDRNIWPDTDLLGLLGPQSIQNISIIHLLLAIQNQM